MKTGPFLFALAAVLTATSTAQAQGEPRSDSSAAVPAVSDSATTRAHAAVPSSIDAPAAVQRTAVTTPSAGFAMAPTAGLGRSKAMMGVGIAGLIAGALIGGDSGKIIMVGSAVVGLYGLYLYLQ